MFCFQNDGLMPLAAATTFGINVKLGENPIGFFGTGLKYAIAVCLRLGGTFRLFLGETEYEFYTDQEDFRGTEFGMIRVRRRKGFLNKWKKEKLGYTTELGKHWEPWMAVRELESNTRDEAGNSFIIEDTGKEVSLFLREHGHIGEGRTVIVIDCPEMEEAYLNEEIFLPPEKELVLEIGPLSIYDGPSNYIFFRGLRVTDLNKPSLYTYDFNLGVTLTEDRTSKWPYSDGCRIMEAIMATANQDIIDKVLDADEDAFYEGSLPFDQPHIAPSTPFFASMGYRANTDGGVLPKRVRTMYRNLTTVEERKEQIDVSLTEKQIRWLIENIDQDDIIEACKEALSEEDIPF